MFNHVFTKCPTRHLHSGYDFENDLSQRDITTPLFIKGISEQQNISTCIYISSKLVAVFKLLESHLSQDTQTFYILLRTANKNQDMKSWCWPIQNLSQTYTFLMNTSEMQQQVGHDLKITLPKANTMPATNSDETDAFILKKKLFLF